MPEDSSSLRCRREKLSSDTLAHAILLGCGGGHGQREGGHGLRSRDTDKGTLGLSTLDWEGILELGIKGKTREKG